jgi:hypothetical protein
MVRVAVCLTRFASRGVGVFAEQGRITVGKDLHQPAIKVIDWVVHDGLESAVVFSMSFLNVVFQSDADISVFAAQSNEFRSQHFNILHRNFGHAICAAVEFLFLRS